jgi:aspartokinase
LHAGALEPAERGGIVVRVANVADPDSPGSRIEAATPVSGPLAIAHREALALYRETLSLGRDQGAQLAELLAALAAAGLEPYRAGFTGREVVVLVPDDERALALAARRGSRVQLARGLASFALVGRDVGADEALRARVAALAASAGLSVESAPGGVDRASLVFLAQAATLSTLVRAVHAGLFGAVLPPRARPAGPPQPVRSSESGTPRPDVVQGER